jgi:hypothetical protein
MNHNEMCCWWEAGRKSSEKNDWEAPGLLEKEEK